MKVPFAALETAFFWLLMMNAHKYPHNRRRTHDFKKRCFTSLLYDTTSASFIRALKSGN